MGISNSGKVVRLPAPSVRCHADSANGDREDSTNHGHWFCSHHSVETGEIQKFKGHKIS